MKRGFDDIQKAKVYQSCFVFDSFFFREIEVRGSWRERVIPVVNESVVIEMTLRLLFTIHQPLLSALLLLIIVVTR